MCRPAIWFCHNKTDLAVSANLDTIDVVAGIANATNRARHLAPIESVRSTRTGAGGTAGRLCRHIGTSLVPAENDRKRLTA